MLKVYNVEITRQAHEQMLKIVNYITHELFAPDAALNLINKMENSISNLSQFPRRYPLLEEEPWKSKGIRKMVIHHFLIYYWIDEPQKKVQITAIIYAGRNQLNQLKDI